MILDFHTHCFPDTLAPKAIAALTATSAPFGYTPLTDGTVGGLLASMDRAGIDRAVVCNIATNARQMSRVNDFAIATAQSQPRLIPFGSIHPEATEAEMDTEFNRLQTAGIVGIKIHPDYVKINVDDPSFAPIFARCETRGMIVVTHAGFDPVSPDHIHCPPEGILRVMADFPKLKLVAAHTGGFNEESKTLELLCGTSVYIDTSLSAIRVNQAEQLRAILRLHDPNRILFATDTPWSSPKKEIAFIRETELEEELTDKIFHGNAEALLSSCTR